jgi:hypothetical protein
MPGSTLHGLPYPLPADSINVPRDVQALAEATDPKLVHSFANKAALDLWVAPEGSRATTTTGGKVGSVPWLRQNGIWVPMSAGYQGSGYSLGGFPAGAYSWPSAGPTNIAGYGFAANMLYDTVTKFPGIWTATFVLYIAPSDAGHCNVKLEMGDSAAGGLMFQSTVTMIMALASVVGQCYLPAGAAIKWFMHKEGDSVGWTQSSVRFGVSFQPT